MGSVKRKIRRRQRPGLIKTPLSIDVWCEDGNLVVFMCNGFWYGATAKSNTGLPDCNLPWLAEKIGERLGRTISYSYEDLLCVADAVIDEQKPLLISLADNRGNGKGKGRFVRILARLFKH